jgi:hypothetical protein
MTQHDPAADPWSQVHGSPDLVGFGAPAKVDRWPNPAQGYGAQASARMDFSE